MRRRTRKALSWAVIACVSVLALYVCAAEKNSGWVAVTAAVVGGVAVVAAFALGNET